MAMFPVGKGSVTVVAFGLLPQLADVQPAAHRLLANLIQRDNMTFRK